MAGSASPLSTSPTSSSTSTTAAPPTSTTASVPSTTAATTTTSRVSPTSLAPTTAPATTGATTTALTPAELPLPATVAAFDGLAAGNLAVSLSVWRDGSPVLQRASGSRVDGEPLTTDTPMVIASVSKLVTALTVARLVQTGILALDERVPWADLGIPHDPGWDDVAVRELLAHTSGMPVARSSWLDLPGSCATPLAGALSAPPLPDRGTWRYSNGNYCALGLLIEHVTGEPLDAAARRLVFDPAGVSGPHLTTDGHQPTDGPYAKDIARFDRLGGAGTWMASTDDLAAMLRSVSDADRVTLAWPGVIVDQYGWGHTGTVDGAKACAWLLEEDRTIVVAVVAGNRQATGGAVCDIVVPAVAADLGIWAGAPVRSPP